ncbi:MAG: hypothetical protein U5L06_04830 [Rhodovibrio sp.]|nr:hypothetical protein [Rhodovibrio sp.]
MLTIAPRRAAQHRGRQPDSQESAGQVGRDHPVPVGQGEVFGRRFTHDPGDVEQRVEAVRRAFRDGGESALQLLCLGDVGREGRVTGPSPASSPRAASSASVSASSTATCQPPFSSRRAIALPIPCAPPVTTAV